MDDLKRTYSWLSEVDKPARYTGGELHMVRKDKQDKLRFALCFPDVYEVGMSHLGSRILYEVLNGMDNVYCERSYAPWPDAEEHMRANKQKLYALETGDALDAFDVLGFSLLYEMSYTNILNMMDMAGIPLRADQRGEQHPLIAAGGPCAFNPEPLAPFIDVVMLGDGEQSIAELAQASYEAKQNGEDKATLLRKLAGRKGFYVPSLYTVQYHEDGTVRGIQPEEGAPEKVQKRIVSDLDSATYPTKPLVPFTSIVHDRAVLEIFRGCTRGCRFCQAGYIYRPVRERKRDTLVAQAKEIIRNTGYEEISLTSLSSGDYSELSELIEDLGGYMDEQHVSLALPSLRIDSFRKDFAEGTARVRKSGLTFAPEAATQRLRDVINKGVNEEDLLRSVRSAFEAGYTSVKLYFMIGLPTETDEDLLGMADLAGKVIEAYYELPKELRPKPPQVTVSASPFVPKPFTPFQWEAQDSIQEFQRKQNLLKDAFRKVRRAKFGSAKPQLSMLEAVVSRGDRRVADVIERAFRMGARMDGWSELFDFELWMNAFEAEGISPSFYANRVRGKDEVFPYEHIDVGVSRAYLWGEHEAAMRGEVTQDCRQGCLQCGLQEVEA